MAKIAPVRDLVGAVTRDLPAPGRFFLVNPEGTAAKRPSLRHLVTRTGRQGAGPRFTAMNRPRVLQAAGPAEWRRPVAAPAAAHASRRARISPPRSMAMAA